MRTLAVSNYKGGVGKTTTAVNLAAIYAARGLRVLLIDLDPQASATDYFGLYDRAAADGRTSIQLLYENAPVSEVAYETEIPNLSVVPSIIELNKGTVIIGAAFDEQQVMMPGFTKPSTTEASEVSRPVMPKGASSNSRSFS